MERLNADLRADSKVEYIRRKTPLLLHFYRLFDNLFWSLEALLLLDRHDDKLDAVCILLHLGFSNETNAKRNID